LSWLSLFSVFKIVESFFLSERVKRGSLYSICWIRFSAETVILVA
jgi:hypothetical protein